MAFGPIRCTLLGGMATLVVGHARDPILDESATSVWLANELGRRLEATQASLDVREISLALLALDAGPVVVIAREALRSRQLEDGSFPCGAACTRLAALALEPSNEPEDMRAHARANAFLAAPPSESTPEESGSLGRALEFLSSSRTNRSRWTELDALAGAPFDTSDAYRLLQNAPERAGSGLCDALGISPLGGDATECLLAARVLAAHGSAALVGGTGRAVSWPAFLLDRLERLRHEGGSYGPAPGARADLAATAAASLALDTISRWKTLAVEDLARAAEPRRYAVLPTECEACHQELQPGMHRAWAKSRHAAAGVGCAACHGDNHSKIFREEGRASPAVCAECHASEVEDFLATRHAHAEDVLVSSALFASTPEAARAACFACHDIGSRNLDGTVGSCNHCHVGHGFDAQQASEPGACTVCHTGADYPQDQAYALSKHGVLYASSHDAEVAPTCSTCHHPGGFHGDFGMTVGCSGTGGILAGKHAPIEMRSIDAKRFRENRGAMVAVCARCHSSRFAEESLREADRIKAEGNGMLAEAVALLTALHEEGLLGDQPLVLGGRQVRADPRRPESPLLDRFYEMWRFHYAATWKGAYHNSPSITNLQSLAGLKDDLAFLRSAAERLRVKESGR